jgi:hypothetical protein
MKELAGRLWRSKIFWALVVICALYLSVWTITAFPAEYIERGTAAPENAWRLEPNEFIITEEEAREALVAVGERDELQDAIGELQEVHEDVLEEYRSASGFILILQEDRTRLLGSVEFWGKVAGIAIGVGLAGWAAFIVSLVL